MAYFSSSNTLEWINWEFEEFTVQNTTLPLRRYKYFKANFKYSNILDVYEQTKKLKAEELAQIFDKNYRFNQKSLMKKSLMN